MNNTLSFPRLLQVMRKHWIENLSFYGMAVLAMIGILSLVLAMFVLTTGNYYLEDGLYVIYLVGLFIIGCILASVAFSMLGDKAKGGFWLSLPASHLEKLITVVFFTTVVFFAVYSACFFGLKAIAMTVIESRVAEHPDKYHLQRVHWNGERETDGFGFIFKIFLFIFFAVQALFLMGSAYFGKFAFIKTIIIAAILIFFFVWYTYQLNEWLMPRGVYTGDFMVPSKKTIDVLQWVVRLIWAPLFWLITWFRLKEKEL
jgi:hypothetical protein